MNAIKLLLPALITLQIMLYKPVKPINDTLSIDDIKHPYNEEFIVEVAFNLDIPIDSVTQEQFNERYINLK